MSMIKISEYLFFLKACYYGHQLLEKCYEIQKVYVELLLDYKHPRKMAAPLKVLRIYNDQALTWMNACYLECLIDETVEQQTIAQSALVPIWDYALVLNDQHNRYTFLSEEAFKAQKPLKKIESFYQCNPESRGVFFVQQLKKLEADVHFIHQKILTVLKNHQSFLDQKPLKSSASNIGVFKALMEHLGHGFRPTLSQRDDN